MMIFSSFLDLFPNNDPSSFVHTKAGRKFHISNYGNSGNKIFSTRRFVNDAQYDIYIRSLDSLYSEFENSSDTYRSTKLDTCYSDYYKFQHTPSSCSLRAATLDDELSYSLKKRIRELGILELTTSRELREFVRELSGEVLVYGTGIPRAQLLCFKEGDYFGLHSDWVPELHSTGRFIVVNFNFPNRCVIQQQLIYEKNGFLSGTLNLARPLFSVYRLPFWHMSTPLLALNGHSETAHRWLLSISFKLRS